MDLFLFYCYPLFRKNKGGYLMLTELVFILDRVVR